MNCISSLLLTFKELLHFDPPFSAGLSIFPPPLKLIITVIKVKEFIKKKFKYKNWLESRFISWMSCQIEAFNNEEEAFGWQTTAYPQRQTIQNTLKPYLSLYELTVEFNNKYKWDLLPLLPLL